MKRRIDLCEIEFSHEACEISPETAGTINEVVSPIKLVKPDDVYVRTMFVTSDKLNSQGGRFQPEEIEELCRLIPGAPVLVGHDKRRLPIARCFKVETVDRNGENWVKVWFYWLRDTEGADDLLKNIDGGIYTECSLGFSFKLPECSICGGDIRKCSHVPGREYRGASGQMELCHFLYRKITRVNEISLVYRGAVPGTAISEQEIIDELVKDSSQETEDCFSAYAFGNGAVVLEIPFGIDGKRQIVFPHYSEKLLGEGKIMVGQYAEDLELTGETGKYDSGAIRILGSSDDGVRFRSEGRRLNGEYILRSAILQKEKVVLLYRTG
jgi:hypothetical protein